MGLDVTLEFGIYLPHGGFLANFQVFCAMIQLEKTEDKLHSLFLVDSKIKLEEMDRVYTIENIEDLISVP